MYNTMYRVLWASESFEHVSSNLSPSFIYRPEIRDEDLVQVNVTEVLKRPLGIVPVDSINKRLSTETKEILSKFEWDVSSVWGSKDLLDKEVVLLVLTQPKILTYDYFRKNGKWIRSISVMNTLRMRGVTSSIEEADNYVKAVENYNRGFIVSREDCDDEDNDFDKEGEQMVAWYSSEGVRKTALVKRPTRSLGLHTPSFIKSRAFSLETFNSILKER